MSRWRLITLSLIVLALGLWAVLLGLNLRPELARELPHGLVPSPDGLRLDAQLSRLPAWVPSVELFVTLFLAGVANLFLFPARVRNMMLPLGLGWRRLLAITLLGIGIGLLIIVFALGAALARITFPFTILSMLALMFLSVWGLLAVAFALGRILLVKAGWGRLSPVLDLGVGLLLLLPLMRIPFAGGIVMIIYTGLGLGLVIATRFGSNRSWSLIPLLEDWTE